MVVLLAKQYLSQDFRTGEHELYDNDEANDEAFIVHKRLSL